MVPQPWEGTHISPGVHVLMIVVLMCVQALEQDEEQRRASTRQALQQQGTPHMMSL
jgi:hypothetical protein